MDKIIELAPLTQPDPLVGVVQHEAATLDFAEEKVQTSFGLLSVEVVGDRKRPAIVTYHDIGLNGNSCFQGFFQFSEMAFLSERFCVYHINAPGQEDHADRMEPMPGQYPTMDDLSHQIDAVVEHFNLKNFIGFGVGMGANILIRYAMKRPKVVESLILVNSSVQGAGWVEWGYEKMNISYLRSRGMTTFTIDYLIWHHFGKHTDDVNPDMIESYRSYFAHSTKPTNLAALIESWIARTPIELYRSNPLDKSPVTTSRTLACPVLQLIGDQSPHIDASTELNSKLEPSKSDWMKVSDSCGMVLEDQPAKVTEAIILWLQGQGYFPTLSHAKWVAAQRQSKEQTTPGRTEHAFIENAEPHHNIANVNQYEPVRT